MKACPNCGKPYFATLHVEDGETGYVVQCLCGTSGPFCESAYLAEDAWDALPRRDDAAAESQLAELTSMLQAREAQRDEALSRYDQEHQRAERLADVVRTYGKMMNDADCGNDCVYITPDWVVECEIAAEGLHPGDLGGEE